MILLISFAAFIACLVYLNASAKEQKTDIERAGNVFVVILLIGVSVVGILIGIGLFMVQLPPG